MRKINTFLSFILAVSVCWAGLSNAFWTHLWDKQFSDFHPQSTEKDLTFRLFTRKNWKNGIRLRSGESLILSNSPFNRSNPIIICTHGYMDFGSAPWIRRIRNEFLEESDVNFISLDWAPCSKNLLYDKVIQCMKQTAKHFGTFLNFLHRDGRVDWSDFHLIGHSLGAHLAALASATVAPRKTIGRITGLDPAAPLFEYAKDSERLNPHSAQFVDVIHTSILFLGIVKPIGTVNFYPNGGYLQPSCPKLDLNCHHKISQLYFSSTINKKYRGLYPAKKCKTLNDAIKGTCYGETAYMGYHSIRSSPGIYYGNVTWAPSAFDGRSRG